MIKSARLVAVSGLLLFGSVALLPCLSFAATTIVQTTENVSATVNGYLALSATAHVPDTSTGVTYDSTTNTYIGTFSLMGSTDRFGITTYEVTCNYMSDPASVYSGDCSNGWTVSAEASNNDTASGAAAMVPSDVSNTYRIKSTSPAVNPLSGTTANWLMKITGVGKTVGGSTFTPNSSTYSYNNFNVIPPKNNSATVVEGNTFRTVSGVNNTYIGTESFQAQYGFTAGMDAVAGTYTGTVTYTLHVKPTPSS